MARPLTKINPQKVRKLASFGLSSREIAEFFDIHESQISRRFQSELRMGRARLKLKLRRKQLKVALEDGNPAMLIWLGKSELGQQDTVQVEHSGKLSHEHKIIEDPQAVSLANALERRLARNAGGNGVSAN